MNFTVITKVTIEEDRIASLFVGLNETFPCAWFQFHRWPYADDPADDHKLVLKLPIVVHDLEDGDERCGTYELTKEKLQKGLQIMAEKYPLHFHDLATENDDVDTADCFLQCCCFGELVYG